MLSKKMTFSLMSLIIITALAFVAPSAMAQVKVTVSGLTSVPHAGTADQPADTTVDIVVETDKAAAMPTLTAAAFNKDGLRVDLDEETMPESLITFALNADMENTAKKQYITMTVPLALNGVNTDTDGGANLPLRVVVTIPVIGPSDPSDDTDASADSVSHNYDYDGLRTGTEGHPKVVSIQRLRPGSQSVVSAFQEAIVTVPSFDVRIVFTEKWNVDLAKIDDMTCDYEWDSQ